MMTKLSNRIKYLLMTLLVTLNIALRYPLKGHEYIGNPDTISIHIIAGSISQFNYAKFYLNPLSYFGFYPYSYPSGILFLSSAINQMGINMEWTIWLVSTFIGVLGGFTMYLLAGEINNNDLFKFFAALTFSVSYGFLYVTMWTLSTRGAFVALTPLFLFLLLKARRKREYKYIALASLLFLILITIHHMYILLVPFIIAYFITKILYKHKQGIKNFKISKFGITVGLASLFAILFFLPLLLGLNERYGYQITNGSIEMNIIDVSLGYAKKMGLMSIFAIIGFTFLLYSKKNFENWFLIIGLLIFASPMTVAPGYISTFLLFFTSSLIALGMIKIIHATTYKKKAVFSIIITILIISTIISGSFLHGCPNDILSGQPYIDDKTYDTALWTKKYANGTIVTDPCFTVITAITGIYVIPTFPQADLIYGYIDKEHIKIKIGPIDQFFNHPLIDEHKNELTSRYKFPRNHRYDDDFSQRFIQEYDVSYALEKYEEGHKSIFMRSVDEDKYKIYENEEVDIWYIG